MIVMDLEEFANTGFDPKQYVNRLCDSQPDAVPLDRWVLVFPFFWGYLFDTLIDFVERVSG